MVVLGIQTVEFPNSVAVIKSDSKHIKQIFIAERNQTVEILSEIVDEILSKLNLSVDDIELVSVCIGPGSYTGARGGVAFAKGFCQFSRIPLIAVNAFEVLKSQIPDSKAKNAVYMLDAGNDRVFYMMKADKADVTDVHILLSNIKSETLFVGSGAVKYKNIIKRELGNKAVFVDDNELTAKKAASAGMKKFEKDKKGDDVYRLNPLYILKPNITKPRKKK